MENDDTFHTTLRPNQDMVGLFYWCVKTLNVTLEYIDDELILCSDIVTYVEGRGGRNFDNYLPKFLLGARDGVYGWIKDKIGWYHLM